MLSWLEKVSSIRDSNDHKFLAEFSSSLAVKAYEISTDSSIRATTVGPATKLRKMKDNIQAIFFIGGKNSTYSGLAKEIPLIIAVLTYWTVSSPGSRWAAQFRTSPENLRLPLLLPLHATGTLTHF